MAYHRQQGVDTGDRADLQHLRPADAPARRPRDPDVHAPGAAGPADHRLRRRLADALVLLRVGPDRRDHPAGGVRATTTRSTSATRTSSRCSSSPTQVIEVTGSRSEIVHEALPTDDPQVRQPDISLAREMLGWEPKVELREGLRRTLEESGVEALTGAGAPRRRACACTHRDLPDETPLLMQAAALMAAEPAPMPDAPDPKQDAERGRAAPRPRRCCPPVDVRRKRPPALSFLLRMETLRRASRVVSLLALDFAGAVRGDLHRADGQGRAARRRLGLARLARRDRRTRSPSPTW